MGDEMDRKPGHLNLGLGEAVVLGEETVEVKPDQGSQNEAAGGDAAGATDEEPPFAGGAGEGDDLPESGLRP
jgi:hypothetical protein